MTRRSDSSRVYQCRDGMSHAPPQAVKTTHARPMQGETARHRRKTGHRSDKYYEAGIWWPVGLFDPVLFDITFCGHEGK